MNDALNFSYLLAGFLVFAALAVAVLTFRTLRPLFRKVETRADLPKPIRSTESSASRVADSSGEMLAQPGLAPMPVRISAENGNAPLCADRLLTNSELCFYKFLSRITAGEWIIVVKIPLSQVLKQKARLEKSFYSMYQRGHIDFLLLDPLSSLPVLAIELDDWRHQLQARQERDQRKDKLLQAAGLRLQRVAVGEQWGDETAQKIKAALPDTR